MKVLEVEKSISKIVTTDDEDWPIYRRYSADSWEVLMGESWESLYLCEKVEKAYQEYTGRKNGTR